MKKVYLSLGLAGLFLCTVVTATSIRAINELVDPKEQLNRFKITQTIGTDNLLQNQVVGLELKDQYGDSHVLVDSKGKQVATKIHKPVSSRTSLPVSLSNFSSEFTLRAAEPGIHYFDSRKNTHQFEVMVNASVVESMDINLSGNILPPQSVSVEYKQDDQWIPVVSDLRSVRGIPLGSLSSGESKELNLRVTLKTKHLLAIQDVYVFSQKEEKKPTVIAWLAQKDMNYTLYRSPSFGQKTNFYVKQEQPLGIDEVTPKASVINTQENPFYNPDFDKDGVNDEFDLCPRNTDPLNTDLDKNGRGDVCEDKDQDGYIALEDNCPLQYNPNQEDMDADGAGDVCDETDDRVTETLPYLQVILFGLLSLMLLWLVYRSTKK